MSHTFQFCYIADVALWFRWERRRLGFEEPKGIGYMDESPKSPITFQLLQVFEIYTSHLVLSMIDEAQFKYNQSKVSKYNNLSIPTNPSAFPAPGGWPRQQELLGRRIGRSDGQDQMGM